MKNVLTTVRLPRKVVKELDDKAKSEKTDRTTILRKLLEEGLKNSKKDEAIQLYKENRISLSEAARRAGLYVGEMMEELVRKGVKSTMTVEDYKKSLATALNVFRNKKET